MSRLLIALVDFGKMLLLIDALYEKVSEMPLDGCSDCYDRWSWRTMHKSYKAVPDSEFDEP